MSRSWLIPLAIGVGVGIGSCWLGYQIHLKTSPKVDPADFDFVLFYEHERGPWQIDPDERNWDSRGLELDESQMKSPNDYPVFIGQECGLKEWEISSISGNGVSDAGDGAYLTIPRRTLDPDKFICIARFAKSPFVNFVKEDPFNAQTH